MSTGRAQVPRRSPGRHGGAEDARHGVPLGPGADLQDDRALYHRGGLRGRGRHREGRQGALKDELGDLLLQVVYHARMAEEEGAFAFADVADAIAAKMIRRHPHVFGTEAERTAGAAPGFWERIKADGEGQPRKRSAADAERPRTSVPAAPPRAHARRQVAGQSRQGGVRLALAGARVRQAQGGAGRAGASRRRRQQARGSSPDRAKIEEEFGDLLFVVANVARHLKIDPEAALRSANQKFIRRFGAHRGAAGRRRPRPRAIDAGRDGPPVGPGQGRGARCPFSPHAGEG